MSDYEKFKKLWKVKLLSDVKDLEDMEGTIKRNIKASIRRDLKMIRYGFDAGLKEGRRK